jgi:hypothetical protein
MRIGLANPKNKHGPYHLGPYQRVITNGDTELTELASLGSVHAHKRALRTIGGIRSVSPARRLQIPVTS